MTKKSKRCFHIACDESEFEKRTEAREMGQHNKQARKSSWNDTRKKGHFWGVFRGSKKGSKMAFFWGPSNTLALCWKSKICCAWTNFMMQTHQAWRVAALTSKNVKKPVLGRLSRAWYFIRPWKTSKMTVFEHSKIDATTCWTSFNIIIVTLKNTFWGQGGSNDEGPSGHENRLVGTSNFGRRALSIVWFGTVIQDDRHHIGITSPEPVAWTPKTGSRK